MADKDTKLAITISTVDRATAKIREINKALDDASKPRRDLGKALGDYAEKSGLSGVADGFKGVGAAIGDLLSKVAMIGGVVGLAGIAVFHLVDEFDLLGDKAQRMGVGVDFLAAMRYAAKQAGAPVEDLDVGLEAMNVSLGKARAGTGRMAAFMAKSTPELLKHMKAAKSNEEAFYLLSDAMAKIEDPAKRAALAAATVGNSSLAPLLAQGAKGVKGLADEYIDMAGSQQDAADKAGLTDAALHKLHAATDGVKAAIVSGLSPALTVLIDQLRTWLSGHREQIAQWASQIGEKLPAAVHAVVDAVVGAVKWVVAFVDKIGGLKTAALAVVAVLVGPLVSALVTLGAAMLMSPLGPLILELAAVAAGAAAAILAIKALAAVGRMAGEKIAYKKLVRQHRDEIRENSPDLSDDEIDAQARQQATYDIGQSHAREDLDDKTLQAQIEGPAKPADTGPTVADQLDATKAALAFQNTSLAKGIAAELAAVLGTSKSKVTIDITGAPKGTRVKTDPSNTGDVDLSVGQQMSFGT